MICALSVGNSKKGITLYRNADVICALSVGNSKKGITLYRNADVLLRTAELDDRDCCLIIVCKVCQSLYRCSYHRAVLVFLWSDD